MNDKWTPPREMHPIIKVLASAAIGCAVVFSVVAGPVIVVAGGFILSDVFGFPKWASMLGLASGLALVISLQWLVNNPGKP